MTATPVNLHSRYRKAASPQHPGEIVEVAYDEHPISPRDADNLGVIVTGPCRYDIGDLQFEDADDLRSYIKQVEAEGGLTWPLYSYSHGGLRISLEPYSCPWDSGRIGSVVVTAEALRDEGLHGGAKDSDVEKARRIVEREIGEFDEFLGGEVLRGIRAEIQRCNLGHAHYEKQEPLRGYIGLDPFRSGLLADLGIASGTSERTLREGWTSEAVDADAEPLLDD